ncbi:hypothetical protein [Ruegeria sp. HKCCD7318]|uniref:hypothetical protein n=1 Tax=Ruegeria sp. HKCCD7318 TaxID=2683014 RepID=UPI001492C68F|nr:hypothetical protein [Ruegeria sp. HKCCD7318]NOE33327.1 hypothetical protein [Ruegeria sp. HKCCD7318]
MWVAFSTPEGSGFFSAVAKDEDGKTSGPNIGARVCLRFRRAQDAELLRDYGMDGEVIETPGGDYRYRVFIPRNHLMTVLMKLGERMDYTNFKDSIPADDIALADACHKAWDVFGNLQPGGPYGMRDFR